MNQHILSRARVMFDAFATERVYDDEVFRAPELLNLHWLACYAPHAVQGDVDALKQIVFNAYLTGLPIAETWRRIAVYAQFSLCATALAHDALQQARRTAVCEKTGDHALFKGC